MKNTYFKIIFTFYVLVEFMVSLNEWEWFALIKGFWSMPAKDKAIGFLGIIFLIYVILSIPRVIDSIWNHRNPKSKECTGRKCNFPDDGCVHTSTAKKGSCEWCELYY